MIRYTTDRARPGLVTFYDIQRGKWSGSILPTPKPTREAIIRDYRPSEAYFVGDVTVNTDTIEPLSEIRDYRL